MRNINNLQDDSIKKVIETTSDNNPLEVEPLSMNEEKKATTEPNQDQKDEDAPKTSGNDAEENPAIEEGTGEKEVTEINLEQTNISGTAQKQKNKTSLYLNIHSHQFGEGQNLNFYDFIIKDYGGKVSLAELSYIDCHVKEFASKFDATRIAVVNSKMDSEEIALATIEAFISHAADNVTKPRLYSYTIDRETITLDMIINSFKKDKKEMGKSRTSKSILVIYGHKEYAERSPGILKPVINKGGIADALTNTLKAECLFIIYLCNDLSLYPKHIHDQPHASLINISPIHLYLYENEQDQNNFSQLMRLAEIAISEYNWLSKTTWNEQQEKITGLKNAGQLESTLESLINRVDQEEQKNIANLAKSPLNRIVLFTAAFFEGVSIKEFSCIVKCLFEGQNKTTSGETIVNREDYLAVWREEADEILINCGIVRHSINNGFSTYRFESRSRKTNTINIFCEKYSLQLLGASEIIENTFLLKETLSESILEGMLELAFVNAVVDQERYLAGTCLSLLTQLESIEDNDSHRKDLFFRLLYCIQKWSDSAEYSAYLRRFYHRMMETASRRNIMGAILTYICVPERPENLIYLKSLLNAAGDEEYFIKNQVTQIIAYNYLEDPLSFLSTIVSWNEGGSPEKPSISFAFAYSSLLLEFYGKRFDCTKARGLDYQLIKRSTDDNSGELFRQLIPFIFFENSQAVFNLVFGPVIRRQLFNIHLIDKIQVESFFSMYAFILIRIYFLLGLVKEEHFGITINTQKMMEEILLHVKEKYMFKSLLSALHTSIKKYNEMIVKENSMINRDINKKAVYKTKRDAGRSLIQLMEQIS